MDLAYGMRPGKVTGIISALPREGKTTMSVNLGQLMASSGASVLLIDADLRNPTLSRNLTASADSGLLEVISGQERLEDAIWSDPTTGLGLLPAGRSAGVINTSEVLASTAMQTFLDRLRGEYDYILVDLPPVCAAVDVKAVSPFIDMFVMVIKWGETSPDAVLEALASIPNPQKIIGSVLAGANPSLLSRLEGYKGRHYAGYFSA
jgi:succinoglycan biosynthesis transport protein ExoP